MQKNKIILYKWMILAVSFSGFLFDAPPSVVAANATAPYTFQPLAISVLSPASNQVIPSNHPLQIQLNTSNPNWLHLRLMFEEGLYDLRLLNISNNKVNWYFPLPKHFPNLPPNVSNTISYSNLSLTGNTLPTFQMLNVRDFGAVGDGVADDTAAFTNTLGQLKKDGGILVVPAGT